MKLKELPRSWWTARQLSRRNIHALQNDAATRLPVIVSLTSIPARLGIVHLTIRSLLNQSHQPEKIILWLNQDLEGALPRSLTSLEGGLFEVRFKDLTCPHRKLIFSLEEFPDHAIVTCDDDLMYNDSWLHRLYQDHLHHPGQVIAHECRLITFAADGSLAPYDHWKTEKRTNVSEPWLMSIGYGGVLYPPRCLYSDVQNRELFLKLTPRADDLWFKAMSHLAGTATRRSSNPGQKPLPIIGSQKESLKKTNVRGTGNYDQWLAVCGFYQLAGKPIGATPP